MNVCSSPPGPRAPSRHFGASHELRRCDLAAPELWDRLWEYTGRLRFRSLENKKQLLTKPSHSTPEPHPPLVGGPWSSESGRSPNPHRPVLLVGSTRPASVEGPESQLAGGGSLRGTHRLLRGPSGPMRGEPGQSRPHAHERAPLAASVETKHTLSTAQAGRCSRCAWLLLRQPGARALSARPTCLPYASAPRGAAVASGLEPAKPGGTARGGP